MDPRTERLHGSLVMTIPRRDRVSTENGWKSVLLENFNCINLNRFWLKRLIPIKHDLYSFKRSMKRLFQGVFISFEVNKSLRLQITLNPRYAKKCN